MYIKKKNSNVIIYLDGRINSDNATQLQQELDKVLAENPEKTIILDVENLIYISSAGLRVLLRLSKKLRNPLTVQNVTSEIYEIFYMTGFTEILCVKKKLRELSIDNCEILGRGAMGTVYRVDEDTIVKVYESPDSLPMIENEQKRAKQAFLKGIPTAISFDIVKVGDKYGAVFELLKATTFNDLLINNTNHFDDIVRQYAYFIRQVHSVEVNRGELPQAKNVFLRYLDALRNILSEDIYNRLFYLFDSLPDSLHIIHGDIQMKNVMYSEGEPLLIDMDTLSVGDPVFDLMGVFITYKLFNEDEPNNTDVFLGLSKELCDNIWEKTMYYYFDNRCSETLSEAENKIKIVAYVRFLYLISVFNIGKDELRQLRIDHTLSHLHKLIFQVSSLEIGLD